MKFTPINPVIQFQDRAPPLKRCLERKRASYAPRPSLLSKCVFILPPVPDFGLHPVQTRLRSGVSRPPESDAPRSFVFAPPPFPQPTCSSCVHVLSIALLLPPPPLVSLCGPHNLVVPHLRLHPLYLMCKGALGFGLKMPESIVRFNSV